MQPWRGRSLALGHSYSFYKALWFSVLHCWLCNNDALALMNAFSRYQVSPRNWSPPFLYYKVQSHLWPVFMGCLFSRVTRSRSTRIILLPDFHLYAISLNECRRMNVGIWGRKILSSTYTYSSIDEVPKFFHSLSIKVAVIAFLSYEPCLAEK